MGCQNYNLVEIFWKKNVKKSRMGSGSDFFSIHLYIPMQSVPITTMRCEFESRSDDVYWIQHYMIKFVSNL